MPRRRIECSRSTPFGFRVSAFSAPTEFTQSFDQSAVVKSYTTSMRPAASEQRRKAAAQIRVLHLHQRRAPVACQRVRAKGRDPRRGRITIEYQDLQLGEPDPFVFASPSGYKIVESPAP